MGCIYKIENKINGMVYIGQSINVHRRWNEERCGKTNKHLSRALKKYGVENFLFEVIEECEDANMNEREKLYIKYYQSSNKSKGYNKTDGGNAYDPHWTDERRKQASDRFTGEGNPFYGKRHSPEAIEKMKQRKGENHPGYGTKRTMETRMLMSSIAKCGGNPMAKKVYQYSKDGCFIRAYNAVSEAHQVTGIGYSAIKNCSGKLSKSAGGFLWSYVAPQDFSIEKHNAERT